MSDAIDRAALHDEVEYRLRTAAAHYRSCGKHGTDPGDFLDREIEAMTERLAGLIAPAPLREEWGTRFGGYVVEGRTDAEYPFFWKGVPPPGVNVHRYRTDWLPADPVEAKAIELHQVAYGGRIGFGHATRNDTLTRRYVTDPEADR